MTKKNIDILFFVDNSIEIVGGAEKSTEVIIDSLKKSFNIGLVQPYSEKSISGISNFKLTKKTRLKHVFKNPYLIFVYIFSIYKIIKKVSPKIIHTQGQISFFLVGLLKKIKLIPNNVVIIHTERGLYSKYSKKLKKIFMFFLKRINKLITTTEYNKDLWIQAFENENLNIPIEVIENTAGEIFENYDFLKDTTSSSNEIVIGFAGRYTDWKNWPLAEEIIIKLSESMGNEFIVKIAVGCLDDRAIQESEKMFQRIKQVIGDRFKGKVNIDLNEMNVFYYSLDVFILTSDKDTESFGRTLIEAMSRKTAVLTTDAGGTAEVVGSRHNVLENADQFVYEIIKYNKDKSLLLKEKERSYERVHSQYTLKKNIDKHYNLYLKYLE